MRFPLFPWFTSKRFQWYELCLYWVWRISCKRILMGLYIQMTVFLLGLGRFESVVKVSMDMKYLYILYIFVEGISCETVIVIV